MKSDFFNFMQFYSGYVACYFSSPFHR